MRGKADAMINSIGVSLMPLSSSIGAFSAAGAYGRMSVPVRENQAIYAHFEHVYGVPSEDGGSRIDRLSVLNALIDRLASIKKDPVFASRASAEASGLDGSGMDAVILRLEKEMRAEAAKPLSAYRLPSPLPSAIALDVLA
jgi:hypothetical protein